MTKVSYTAKAIETAFGRRIETMQAKPDTKPENIELMQRCCAYMQGAYFLETAKAGKVDLGFIDGTGTKPMAVYAIKRLVDMVKLAEADFDLTIGASDQTRYAREMLASLNQSRLTGKQFSRLDQRATGSKGKASETAHGYADGAITDGVKVSARLMATGTTATQSTNTLAVFKTLNIADDNGQRGGAFRWFAKPNSVLLERYAEKIVALVAREQGLKLS